MDRIKIWFVRKFDASIKKGLNNSYNSGYKEAEKNLKKEHSEEILNIQYNNETEHLKKDAEIERLVHQLEKNKKISEKTLKLQYELKRKYIQCDYLVENLYQKIQNSLDKSALAAREVFFELDTMKSIINKDKKLLEIK